MFLIFVHKNISNLFIAQKQNCNFSGHVRFPNSAIFDLENVRLNKIVDISKINHIYLKFVKHIFETNNFLPKILDVKMRKCNSFNLKLEIIFINSRHTYSYVQNN